MLLSYVKATLLLAACGLLFAVHRPAHALAITNAPIQGASGKNHVYIESVDEISKTDPTLSIRDAAGMLAVGVPRAEDGSFGAFCTGTLIAPTVVLTAAHCMPIPAGGKFSDSLLQSISFILPQANSFSVFRVVDALQLPGWSGQPRQGSDLMVLRVYNDATGAAAEQFVPLSRDPDDDETGRYAFLTGAGPAAYGADTDTFEGGEMLPGSGNRLRLGTNYIEGVAQLSSDERALLYTIFTSPYDSTDSYPHTEMEAGGVPGDSGGGLFVNDDQHGLRLAGVASYQFGAFGCAYGAETYFTRVSYYAHRINALARRLQDVRRWTDPVPLSVSDATMRITSGDGSLVGVGTHLVQVDSKQATMGFTVMASSGAKQLQVWLKGILLDVVDFTSGLLQKVAYALRDFLDDCVPAPMLIGGLIPLELRLVGEPGAHVDISDLVLDGVTMANRDFNLGLFGWDVFGTAASVQVVADGLPIGTVAEPQGWLLLALGLTMVFVCSRRVTRSRKA